MHKPIGCFKNYEDYASNITNPEVDENKQYDVEAGQFIDELGNNGEELKDYPDDDYGCDIQHEKAERDCGAR
ncbi:MAG: hypothetical protein ACYDIA_13790 [Candidatus Humimicrobiaceae bacterium]